MLKTIAHPPWCLPQKTLRQQKTLWKTTSVWLCLQSSDIAFPGKQSDQVIWFFQCVYTYVCGIITIRAPSEQTNSLFPEGSYKEGQIMGGGSVASGAPIVDTKSKEYRRDEAFLHLQNTLDMTLFSSSLCIYTNNKLLRPKDQCKN